MTDKMQQNLTSLLTTLHTQAEEYIRRLSENRRNGEEFPRRFSLSYLEAEKRTLQDALRNTSAVKMQVLAILGEAENV